MNYYAEVRHIELRSHRKQPPREWIVSAQRRLTTSIEFSKLISYQWSAQDARHAEAEAIQAMRRAGLQ